MNIGNIETFSEKNEENSNLLGLQFKCWIRMAPETDMETIIEDGYSALKYLRKEGWNDSQIVIGGNNEFKTEFTSLLKLE